MAFSIPITVPLHTWQDGSLGLTQPCMNEGATEFMCKAWRSTDIMGMADPCCRFTRATPFGLKISDARHQGRGLKPVQKKMFPRVYDLGYTLPTSLPSSEPLCFHTA